MKYLVRVNMGYCGADHEEVIDANDEDEAYRMAEEEATQMINISVVNICQECDLPEEECECYSDVCYNCGEREEDCECCQDCGCYLCECEEQE
jgi:hypothetical protein